jgi:hypothetical protein
MVTKLPDHEVATVLLAGKADAKVLKHGMKLYLSSSEDSYLTPVRTCEYLSPSPIGGGGRFKFDEELSYPKDTTILPIDVTFSEAVLYPVQSGISLLEIGDSADVFVGVQTNARSIGNNGFVRLSRGTLFRRKDEALAFSERFMTP